MDSAFTGARYAYRRASSGAAIAWSRAVRGGYPDAVRRGAPNRLAGELSITAPTLRNYLRILETHPVNSRLVDQTGAMVGIEVKAAEMIRSEHSRGLRLLQRRLGDRLRSGFVLYCGEDSLSSGDGLAALPISALWTAG